MRHAPFSQARCLGLLTRRVKIADLEDNMNLQGLPEVTEHDLERLDKYHRHWKRLKEI